MLRTIKKITKETPLIGRVINALKSDNPEENAPSIQAVLDSLTPPTNLLINGDFQINQRGQTTYSATGYSCDMWHLYLYGSGTTGGFSPQDDDCWLLNNGDYTFASINQKISDYYRGKTVTIVGKFKNVNGYCDMIIKEGATIGARQDGYIYGQTAITNDGIYTKTFTIPETITYPVLAFSIYTKGSIEIEYVDLFEGSIAYPHVKEDYAIALSRCQYYIKAFKTMKLRMIYRDSSKFRAYFGFTFGKMASDPIIVSGSANVRSVNYENVYSSTTITKSDVSNEYIEFYITGSDATKSMDFIVVLNNLILSCEPQ